MNKWMLPFVCRIFFALGIAFITWQSVDYPNGNGSVSGDIAETVMIAIFFLGLGSLGWAGDEFWDKFYEWL